MSFPAITRYGMIIRRFKSGKSKGKSTSLSFRFLLSQYQLCCQWMGGPLPCSKTILKHIQLIRLCLGDIAIKTDPNPALPVDSGKW